MCRFFLAFPILFIITSACTKKQPEYRINKNALFLRLPPGETGIIFENTLETREDFDVFRYRNFYNGGGVGIADFNNDGHADVFLTSNMGPNKLFLNKGNWKFEDVTERAGVKGSKIWSTGVSIADVNGDGLLDIYVCNAGDIDGKNQKNELFINKGDLTFSERAEHFGLADPGFSTHAAFFDYDKDGDLDCYVLNNSYRPIASLGYRNLRNVRDEYGGHKLYRNDGMRFIDVSEHAGIFGSVIGFGLGITVGDVNQDNWPDMYVSNDFYERDYLYINNQDGTFSEALERCMGHISMFSMGADLADLNNDGYPEIFSTDMLPEKDERLKTLTSFETYDVYQLRLKNGYYHQFMRNMLHRNNRNGTFSEIGALAGVDATDWSWGALIADFNNDLYKDIYVCNGIYKDVTDQDFVEYLGSSEQMRAAIEGKKIDFGEFVDRMPSVKLSNYMFAGNNTWQYENVSSDWGLDEPSFSNGAAYGDLDNDGDLDLVVNNVNQELFVYKNQSREKNGNHYLALNFKGTGKNSFGLGSSIKAFIGKEIISLEHMPIRGFQSSMDYKMIVGLGSQPAVDSLIITWADNKTQVFYNVRADQELLLDYANAQHVDHSRPPRKETLLIQADPVDIVHKENQFNEFDRDRLLYHMLSTQGPAFAKADLNRDGRDDFYLGGSSQNPGSIYLQGQGGTFTQLENFHPATLSDEVGAVFFDADGDADEDLFVVTGGTENPSQSLALQDRFYLNEGFKGGVPTFSESAQSIPAMYQSGSCVKPADVDDDGDIDLFIGTRVIPLNYGLPCDQFLLLNDGKGQFVDGTSTWAPQLKSLGMVTDAVWDDIDNNGYVDLVVVGEWMPVTIFKNDGRKLTRLDNPPGLEQSEGWWNKITAADIDGDGDSDFVLGNWGLNSKFRPSPDRPIGLYVNDFDENGSIEPIFTYSNGQSEYPLALKQDLFKQMSSLKKKFIYSRDYAGKTIDDIFSADALKKSTVLRFSTAHSSVLLNHGVGGFDLNALPIEAQVSPIYAVETVDINHDGFVDLILGGNLFSTKPEVGRYDAMMGLILVGDGKGQFDPIPAIESGLSIKGEIRHISLIRNKKTDLLAVITNNDSIQIFNIRE